MLMKQQQHISYHSRLHLHLQQWIIRLEKVQQCWKQQQLKQQQQEEQLLSKALQQHKKQQQQQQQTTALQEYSTSSARILPVPQQCCHQQ
jgi:hypothetical protein